MNVNLQPVFPLSLQESTLKKNYNFSKFLEVFYIYSHLIALNAK